MKLFLKTFLLHALTVAFCSCSPEVRSTTGVAAAPAHLIPGDTVPSSGMVAEQIFLDNSGNYWLFGYGDGVYHYDGQTMLHITEKHGLCSNFVSNVQEDGSGKLWFGTREGVCLFDGKKFSNYTSTIENAPVRPFVYKEGGLFFAHLNGICFYDGNSFSNFTIHPPDYVPPKSSLYRHYGLYCTFVDASGNVWFGTQEKGVCKYDGKTFQFITDKNLEGPAVRSIIQDKSGVMWFGNNGGGLFRYDGKTLRNLTEEQNLGNPEFLSGKNLTGKPGNLARVFALCEDKNGHIWIGTVDSGVWKYDGTTFTNYTMSDGLPGYTIPVILKDKEGGLIFISGEGDMLRFNGQAFTPFTF